MKNKFLVSLLTLGASIVSLFSLISCGTSTSQEPSSQPSEHSESSNSTSTLPEKVDYVSQIKLNLDYKGRDFFTEGIGEVKLKTAIDGDTAHFYPVVKTTSNEIIKARFYGIDTPESTGKVQEWGIEASNFTKEKLNKAAKDGTIVVSTPADDYQAPSFDSTGARYISLVWVNLEKKEANFDELKLLNLWIVQEGLSDVKNVQQIPNYAPVFYEANAQAKELKLNKYSGKPAPGFNYGDYEQVSLLDIKKELEACLEDPDRVNKYHNKKVIIVGTVAGFANKILYLQNFYTEEQGGRYEYEIDGKTVKGEFAGINIFVGESGVSSKYTKTNTYLSVGGLLLDSQFGFQMTDCIFPAISKKPHHAKVLISAEDNVDEHKLYEFNKTAVETSEACKNKNTEYMFGKLNVTTKVKCTNAYISDTENITLTMTDEATGKWFKVFMSFIYIGNPDKPNDFWKTPERFKDKEFEVSGIYTIHKITRKDGTEIIEFQLCPCDASDLVCLSL